MQTITLKAANHKYVSAEYGGGVDPRRDPTAVALTASRESVGGFERFGVVEVGDGWVALQTFDGHYVTAEGGGGSFLRTDATEIGAWEKFQLRAFGGGQAILCANQVHYLCAEIALPRCELTATRTVAQSWETFDVSGLPLPTTALPRLRTRGAFLELETGERFTAIIASDFNLFGRFLAGEDIRPVLQQRRDVGFNVLRVWTLMDLARWGIGRIVLEEHPELYDRLPAFLQQCASFGLYAELTAYTGVNDPNHWPRLGDTVLASTNVVLDYVNERDQNLGEPDYLGRVFDDVAWRHRPIQGVLCGHGSNGSQALPVRPAWDFELFHTNGAPEWWRKNGHNAMEVSDGTADWPGSRKPVLTDESTRCPDQSDKPQQYHDAAAGASLLCAGSCFHSVSGKASRLFDERELACAKAHCAGAHSVDLRFQDGRYDHGADMVRLEQQEGLLRAYQRILPSGDAGIVRIRR